MSAVLIEVYAAKAIADYDTRFNKVGGDLLVLKWVVGAILAGVV